MARNNLLTFIFKSAAAAAAAHKKMMNLVKKEHAAKHGLDGSDVRRVLYARASDTLLAAAPPCSFLPSRKSSNFNSSPSIPSGAFVGLAATHFEFQGRPIALLSLTRPRNDYSPLFINSV